MVVAAGLQLVRAVGVKKLIPILAVGGLALGLFARGRTAMTGLITETSVRQETKC